MDWQPTIIAGLICLLLPSQISLAKAWSLPSRHSNQLVLTTAPVGRRLNEVSPYLDLALCPIRAEPWTCARQQSGRILDAWDGELHLQWQKLKVEADRQMNATIERRGYSTSELPVKEKPSTILKKIEIGTNYMKKYLAESMDGFLGREYEYLQTPKAADDNDSETDQSGNSVEDDDEADAADDASNAAEEEENADDEDAEANKEEDEDDDDDQDQEDEEDDDSDSTGEQEQDQEPEADGDAEDEDVDEAVSAPESENEKENAPTVFSGTPAAQPQSDGKNPVRTEDNTSTGVEFIELEDAEENAAGALKKPGSGKRKKNKKGGKRKKNKKKGHGQETQPATLVVVQAAPEHHEVDHGHESGSSVVSHDHDDDESVGKPMKKRKHKRRMKGKRKQKRKGQHGSTSVVEHEPSDLSLGLGLLDELADADDVFSGVGGGKRKHRNPLNYVTRGKKKKKKKAIAKFIMIGSFLKAKIELLLKILGAHLQVKFFAIALIGLLINIARFWIDVKRGSPPSKVVYVEHAHHQHHYEDHGEDWSEPGSYWKRSLQTDPSVEDVDSSTDSYQVRQPQQQSQFQDPHYLAYRNQWQ
ncbi:adoMet-dependent rRNA methyltransferase spb1 isoform X2 [Drosophila subpulchrella]|uniref:adoMet-dependent rRNA methyltransferase spb1 isoform X2 n=1 Tax=Drosophila subpulchrella TaxID=1486046 RepID=UPI0018A14895|nr:adoMet-dependent rRNA methyltransferase spb1 isoform X2 [Drosophila subpulchrella]